MGLYTEIKLLFDTNVGGSVGKVLTCQGNDPRFYSTPDP